MKELLKFYIGGSILSIIGLIVMYMLLHYLPVTLAPEQCEIITREQLIIDILYILLISFASPLLVCLVIGITEAWTWVTLKYNFKMPNWVSKADNYLESFTSPRAEKILIGVTVILSIAASMLVGYVILEQYLCW